MERVRDDVGVFHPLGWAVRPITTLSKNTPAQPEKEPQISPLRFASLRDDKFVVDHSSGFSSTWVGRQADEPSGRDGQAQVRVASGWKSNARVVQHASPVGTFKTSPPRSGGSSGKMI